MDKIDRLGWAAGVSFEVFGLRIGIRVRDPLVLNSLLSRIPAGWIPLESAVVDRLYSVVTPTITQRNVRHLHVLYGDHGRLMRTERFRELLEAFESDVDLHIATNCKDRLFIHAGAVKWDRHVIVIPGRSHSGKTTLVAEFLKRGAAYYSDDFAIVDCGGCLHPYARELSVRSQSDVSKRIRHQQLGASRAEPGPISFVLLTEYAQGAEWKPQPVSRGRGVLGLLENTPSARQQAGFAMEVLQKAVSKAEIHRGWRGEKEQTAQQILSYLDRRRLS
jgi:hypothetical protein